MNERKSEVDLANFKINNSATHIQKIIKGKIQRQEVNRRKADIFKAKLIIMKFWQKFKKNKKKNYVTNACISLKRGLVKSIFRKIKEFYLIRKRKMELLKIAKEKEIELIEKEKKLAQIEEFEEVEEEKVVFTKDIFYSTIVIQRFMRKLKEKKKEKVSEIYSNFPENCEICEKNQTEKVCKICKPKSFYCNNCFMKLHKSSNRKNHGFINLTPQVLVDKNLRNMENLRKTIKEELGIENIKKFKKVVSDADIDDHGLVEFEKFCNNSIRKKKEIYKNNENLYSQIKILIKEKYIADKKVALEKLGKKIYDSEKLYIDLTELESCF